MDLVKMQDNEDIEMKLMRIEFEKRYNSKNMFRPNAGPPEPDHRLFAKMLENRMKRQLKGEESGEKSLSSGIPAAEPPATLKDDIKLNSLELPELIAPTPTMESRSGIEGLIIGKNNEHEYYGKPGSDKINGDGGEGIIIIPYLAGENIFSELFDYLHSNILGSRNATPVLEEDANFFLLTMALSAGNSVIIEGKSRSGKSLLFDRIKPFLPEYIELSGCSNTALLDRHDEVNKAGYVLFTEFQAVVEGNDRVKEAVKNLSESKDYIFSSRGETKSLSGDVSILATSAKENRKTQRRDVEVTGRFLILETSDSPEKRQRITRYKDSLDDGSIKDMLFSEERMERLKAHYGLVLSRKDALYLNPFLKAYSELLPQTQKSIHSRELYKKLINGSANFDFPNRAKKEDGSIFINLSDVYITHEYFHSTYCNNLKRLAAESHFSLSRNQNGLEQARIDQELENEMGLVDKALEKKPDWQKIWRMGYNHMAQYHPESLDMWAMMNTEKGRVVVDDPIAKCRVEICSLEKLSVKETSVKDDAYGTYHP